MQREMVRMTVIRQAYDALGRVAYSMDALGAVTRFFTTTMAT